MTARKRAGAKKASVAADIETVVIPKSRLKRFIERVAVSKNSRLVVYTTVFLLMVVVVLGASRLPWGGITWMMRSLVGSKETYPQVTVLDTNLGSLDANGLYQRVAQLGEELDKRKVVLTSSDSKWTFSIDELGVTFDQPATVRAVMGLNTLGLGDKYRLVTGATKPVIAPVFTIDQSRCAAALTKVTIAPLEPQNAAFYFDQTIKLQPDLPGRKFNAALTCQGLAGHLAANQFTSEVGFENGIPAQLTAADLQPKLADVQGMAGATVSLRSGSYRQDVTPTQLLGLLDVTKTEAGVQVAWSSARLDQLVLGVAGNVNTTETAPALGTCQYLASSGGNRLDTAATKQIFLGLNAGSARSYELAVRHAQAVVGTRQPVTGGATGTVYLTFDDGLTYGDMIMDYAACYNVKVTFFELGSRVGEDAVPLRRAIAEGHAVQSHGFEHAVYDYGQRSYDWQYNDIHQSITAITGVTGVRPTYFRPPGGNHTPNTYSAAAANGVKLVLWAASSIDTSSIGSSAICANVVSKAVAGGTVLMHSTKLKTAQAVPCIIEGLAARGFAMRALW